jgi:hypothetical protein
VVDHGADADAEMKLRGLMVGEGLHEPVSLFVVCALRTAPARGPSAFMQEILHLTAFASLSFSLNDLPKVLELDVWQKSHSASRNCAS